MPLLAEHYWTPEEVLALPGDGQRHECIDGVHIVTPSPTQPHQSVQIRLIEWLLPYIGRTPGVGELFVAPADLRLATGVLVQPDIFVVPPHETARGWSAVKSPLLIVEILSPGSARYDRGLKRRFYQSAPIGEYWIVDLDARVVDRWRPGDERPEVCSGQLVWQPFSDHDPLVIDLPTLFRLALWDGTAMAYKP